MKKEIVLYIQNDAERFQIEQLILNNNDYTLTTLDNIKERAIIIWNGPLTNLANSLLFNHLLKEKIECLLFVGGSDSYGDVTIAAEKNVYDDYYSAQYIFNNNIPIVMFGLNVTRNIDNRSILPYFYLTNRDSFVSEKCGIFVETEGTLTKGKTVVDVYSDYQFDDQHCYIIKEYNPK